MEKDIKNNRNDIIVNKYGLNVKGLVNLSQIAPQTSSMPIGALDLPDYNITLEDIKKWEDWLEDSYKQISYYRNDDIEKYYLPISLNKNMHIIKYDNGSDQYRLSIDERTLQHMKDVADLEKEKYSSNEKDND